MQTQLLLPSGYVERLRKEQQAECVRKAREQWEMEHQRCPMCGNENVWRTTMGCMHPIIDTNQAGCWRCGWSGYCEGLVP